MTIRTYASPEAFKQAIEQPLRTIVKSGMELTAAAPSCAPRPPWTQRLPCCTVAEATALLARYAHF